jgi:hypothetical protein
MVLALAVAAAVGLAVAVQTEAGRVSWEEGIEPAGGSKIGA